MVSNFQFATYLSAQPRGGEVLTEETREALTTTDNIGDELKASAKRSGVTIPDIDELVKVIQDHCDLFVARG